MMRHRSDHQMKQLFGHRPVISCAYGRQGTGKSFVEPAVYLGRLASGQGEYVMSGLRLEP
jgi:pantothenate kinase-related protein Tda10